MLGDGVGVVPGVLSPGGRAEEGGSSSRRPSTSVERGPLEVRTNPNQATEDWEGAAVFALTHDVVAEARAEDQLSVRTLVLSDSELSTADPASVRQPTSLHSELNYGAGAALDEVAPADWPVRLPILPDPTDRRRDVTVSEPFS